MTTDKSLSLSSCMHNNNDADCIISKDSCGSDILGLCIWDADQPFLTFVMYTDHNVLKCICTTVTTHILAYLSHAYETDPTDDRATVILSIFLVSCPFYVLFCFHVLAAPSVILWRRPGPDTIVFQQYQKSIQQRNTTSLLQFKLTFLLATDYQVLHKQPSGLEGGDKAILS